MLSKPDRWHAWWLIPWTTCILLICSWQTSRADSLKIKPLLKPPDIQNSPSKGEAPPGPLIDGFGTIERLEGDEIVIDDALKKMAANVFYYADSGVPMVSGLRVGSLVGYSLNAAGQISALVPLKKPKPRR